MTDRSYLFVPADRPDRFLKALASGADGVIVDLEDAVAPTAKGAARDQLRAWLQGSDARPVLVRINAAQSEWFHGDLPLCRLPAVRGVVVPKAESVEALVEVGTASGGKPLLPLIETAVGFDALRRIAAVPGVGRLVFGSLDFQVDLGIEGDDDALLFFRSQLVLASRLGGLEPPVDGVTTVIDDESVVAHDTARALRLGFGAKLCIHPRQVVVVNRGFTPGEADLDWARRVVAAAQASQGAAIAVDGKMVDAPVLQRAQRLLARADHPA